MHRMVDILIHLNKMGNTEYCGYRKGNESV